MKPITPLNPLFISNIHEIYGQEGDEWLEKLPERLRELSSLWNFRFRKPMPELSYNFVGLVEIQATGRLAILKMAPQSHPLKTEMQWLHCIHKATPDVYATDEKLNAFLMEYLEPGYSLKKLVQEGHDDTATRIICQIIRTIQSQQPSKGGFPPFSNCLKDFSVLRGHFNDRLLAQAEGWFKDLTADPTNDVLLHGDLHHGNILSSGATWKVIDPHGYTGDPAAEVGAMLRNPLDGFPSHLPLQKAVERRLKIIAEELPFDPQKIRQWGFCITVLAAAWSLESHGEIQELEGAVATAIGSVKM